MPQEHERISQIMQDYQRKKNVSVVKVQTLNFELIDWLFRRNFSLLSSPYFSYALHSESTHYSVE